MMDLTNKFILIILIICFLSCDSKERHAEIKKKLHVNGLFISEKQFDKLIFHLDSLQKDEYANKIVDSLLLHDKNNGFLLYEKGIIEEYELNFQQALHYFQTAKSKSYNERRCNMHILICKKFYNVKIK